ncbi:MAG: hypothetical protein RI967_340 [Planctomycetota bacterium]|jgi:hypothetical protein
MPARAERGIEHPFIDAMAKAHGSPVPLGMGSFVHARGTVPARLVRAIRVAGLVAGLVGSLVASLVASGA